MKYKLDDIDKKQSFKVPEGYFEDLPLRIQTKIQKKKKHSQVLLPSWRFAFAASILVILVAYFIADQTPTSVERLLADIPQDDLIAYLDEMELDMEDLTRVYQETSVSFELDELDGLEELELDEEEMDDLFLEYDLNEDYL